MIRLLEASHPDFIRFPGFSGGRASVEAINNELTWLQEQKQAEAQKAEAKRIEMVNMLLDNMDRAKTRNSSIYEALTPDQWVERFKRKNVLEAFAHIPFGAGEMSPDDVNKVHDVLVALAFGKHSVPFVVTLEANENRNGWQSVHLIEDAFFGEDKHECIARPDHQYLSGVPGENVLNFRNRIMQFMKREHQSISSSGGIRISHTLPVSSTIPGLIAIGGTNDASLALGGLKYANQAHYRQIV